MHECTSTSQVRSIWKKSVGGELWLFLFLENTFFALEEATLLVQVLCLLLVNLFFRARAVFTVLKVTHPCWLCVQGRHRIRRLGLDRREDGSANALMWKVGCMSLLETCKLTASSSRDKECLWCWRLAEASFTKQGIGHYVPVSIPVCIKSGSWLSSALREKLMSLLSVPNYVLCRTESKIRLSQFFSPMQNRLPEKCIFSDRI